MTHIYYDAEGLELEVSGHANAGRMGEDIVCAAVSILTQALLQNLKIAQEREQFRMDYEYETPGEFRVKVHTWENFYELQDMFNFVMVGMTMLENKYPEYITIEEGRYNGNL